MNTNEVWAFIVAVENEYAAHRKRIMRQFALSAAETDILMFLANNPAFDTAAAVARIRRIPKSQVSLCVNALCDRQLLTRRRDPDNKKSVHLLLTEAAAPIVTFGHAVQEEFSQTLFADFSDAEKAEYARLHRKIAQNIERKGVCATCK